MENAGNKAIERHLGTLEEVTGQPVIKAQIQAALALCEVATNPRVLVQADTPKDALLVAALAAIAIVETTNTGPIDLVTRSAEEAEVWGGIFQKIALAEQVHVATAETLIFSYLKDGGSGATLAHIAVVADADQILIRDDHTPVILAASSPAKPHALSAETREEAENTLQNGRDYVVQEGLVIIRDAETGNFFPGRRFTRGLHTAIEIREGLQVTDEGDNILQIRMGDYFRRYPALAALSLTLELQEHYVAGYGMSG